MKPIIRSLPVFLMLMFCITVNQADAQKKFTSAIELNNYLTGISDSMYQKGRELGFAINESIKKMDFTDFTTKRKQTEKYTLQKLEEVRAMSNYGGSEELKMAMMDFLKYEIRLIREAFGPFEKLTSKSTKDEINTAIAKIKELAAEENEYIENLRSKQDAYGKLNNFTIEGN